MTKSYPKCIVASSIYGYAEPRVSANNLANKYDAL